MVYVYTYKYIISINVCIQLYKNTNRIAQIEEVEELSIGHSIISKSVKLGIQNAVTLMKGLVGGDF